MPISIAVWLIGIFPSGFLTHVRVADISPG
jgi:hypothetical membrane protein